MVQYLTSHLVLIAAIGLGLGLILLAISCLLSCALIEGNRAVRLPAEEPGKRLYFADNLRTWMVILVVLQHLGEIFGLYLFLMLNQAYFMGLLFLLSGYFTPGSYERKGPWQIPYGQAAAAWHTHARLRLHHQPAGGLGKPSNNA